MTLADFTLDQPTLAKSLSLTRPAESVITSRQLRKVLRAERSQDANVVWNTFVIAR
jgi:hypothetical protein